MATILVVDLAQDVQFVRARLGAAARDASFLS